MGQSGFYGLGSNMVSLDGWEHILLACRSVWVGSTPYAGWYGYIQPVCTMLSAPAYA